MPDEENNSQCQINHKNREDCHCAATGGKCVNSHFTLAIVAVLLSCFTGFFTIALALAALILALRAQDLARDGHTQEAKSTAFWVAVFSWLTIAIVLLPVIAVVFFGGAIMALLGAILSAA